MEFNTQPPIAWSATKPSREERNGIQEAGTKLPKRIPAVHYGEEVIVTKSGKPLVRRVPVEGQKKERPLGW